MPVEDVPAVTLLGLTASPVRAGRDGATVSVAERVTPRPVTEIVTGVGSSTGRVVMSNRPSSVEAFTVANSGTCAICRVAARHANELVVAGELRQRDEHLPLGAAHWSSRAPAGGCPAPARA